ncbi:GNAT family N-acetyltransferase [uncultured Bacteroides sp.]|uniref:GNAT family N-acetyltransferase n=1 Tax=uncultured Bacteroides sp. TaxID=162156 RepID=UPI002AA6A00A|nr:GNAT family N-acetyltransferase [uncultured Bacteroides sp.]
MKVKIEQPDLEICDFEDPSHCAALCNLINEYITDPMGGGTPLTEKQKLYLLDGLETHPRAIVLFVLFEEQIAGMISAFMNFSTFKCKPMINIHDVFVSRDYRGRGLGRKLMQGITEIARNNDCGKITLEVRHDNETAQKLYSSEAFEDGETPMYFWTKQL